MSNPGVRNLALLEASASTARVLNLRQVALDRQGDAEVVRAPFFQHPALNRSLVVKHHLRRNEADLFDKPRSSATKVLLPIDQQNLRAGARFFFVGQRDYTAIMQHDLGLSGADNRDLRMLHFLSEIPSFDPFLLREQLRRRGFEVAPGYFSVSAADTARMMSFAQAEIQPLVDIAFPQISAAGAPADVLARKLLSNVEDVGLEPLRHVLHLDQQQFAEGVFCWKAFLYYKWRLLELAPKINAVTAEVSSIRPHKRGTGDTSDYIYGARANIHTAVITACRNVSQTLKLYDAAYGGLIKQGDGRGFRDFLLQAPDRFIQLGEELASVDHLISFWQYRFPDHHRSNVSADELANIFRDFENSLRIQPKAQSLDSVAGAWGG
jgi:hypothetical protein